MDKLETYIARCRQARSALENQAENAKAALEAAKTTYENLQQDIRLADVEIRALEKAASLRPHGEAGTGADPRDLVSGQSAIIAAQDKSARGGRQPGSISMKWRSALSDVVAAGNAPVEFQQFYLLTRARLGLTEASVKERVRQYVNDGILAESDGMISVSQQSIDRYDLRSLAQSYPSTESEEQNATAPH